VEKLSQGGVDGLYSSQNITRVIKERRRSAGHVESVGDKRGPYRVLVGKPEGKSHLHDIGVDWKILKWNLQKPTGLIWLRIRTNGGLS
jgi:hypothetical protein